MRHARLFPVLLALALPACQTGPLNGTTTSATSVVGKTFTFTGYFNKPSETIRLQVMTDPSKDPSNDANWAQFATATSDPVGEEVNINSTDPLYKWTVTAAPVPNAFLTARWPQGGLVRVRAYHAGTDRVLTTFDAVTFGDCLADQLAVSADWATIGTKCAGLGDGTAALVSTTDTPVAAGDASTNGGFLGRKGEISEAETILYYFTAGVPTSLNNFKSTFAFPFGEVTATFYNDGDLGLGREMHCKAIANGGVACYVNNYDGNHSTSVQSPVFNIDPNTVLADAVTHAGAFATVAMIYTGGTGTNSVKFVAYDKNGDLLTRAKLDSTGNNESVPNNCLSCHGINAFYDTSTHKVSGSAKFLPFDPFSFKYSTKAGFTFNDQVDKFRRLNQLVRTANPTPAIKELIDGMYAPKLVSDPTAVANDTFVPDDWANANGSLDGTALYKGVVKVACRTCHVSAINTTYDFNSADDFSALIGVIREDVCGPTHIMPHAERVMKKFWESGARAYLVTGYGPATYPDALQACKP